MSRKLIVLCDGTWNTRGQKDHERPAPTNVAKLYKALDPASLDTQKTRYLHGVGRGWGPSLGKSWAAVNKFTGGLLDPLFGGASGWGLSTQVQKGYEFLVEQYKEGDDIFIFGFSRGAYAARSLVGLLKHANLLRKDSKFMIRDVVKAYNRLQRGNKHRQFLDSIRPNTHERIRVRFLGVWDTVGALGAPIWGGNFSLNPMLISGGNLELRPLNPRFHDVNALEIVDEAVHAVAMDEQRAAYSPVLFESRDGTTRLEQVWFRGVHCDVGGGYEEAESALADMTFGWMADRARNAGLRILVTKACESPFVRHNSLGNFWLAGVWPRWFPVVTSPDDPEYDPKWGYLHPSVNQQILPGEERPFSIPWLIDLLPGQETDPIQIDANLFWNNTRVIMRKEGHYLVSANNDEWYVSGRPCGPDGLKARLRRDLRAASANPGELVGVVNAPLSEPLPSGNLWWRRRAISNGRRESRGLAYLLLRDPVQLTSLHEAWRTKKGDAKSRSFVPQRTGVFHCFANSAWTSQQKNVGAIRIRIRRVS